MHSYDPKKVNSGTQHSPTPDTQTSPKDCTDPFPNNNGRSPIREVYTFGTSSLPFRTSFLVAVTKMPGNSNFRKVSWGLLLEGLAQHDREGVMARAGADTRGIHSQEAER